jgi:hypothetical protein
MLMTILLKVVSSAFALLVLFTSLPNAQANNYIENKQVTQKAFSKPIALQQRGNEVSRSKIRSAIVANPSSKVSIHTSKSFAKSYMNNKYSWGSGQYSCLVTLWNRESGWRATAHNSSGAHGIPQALPGNKMSKFGKDWYTNPKTQIKWGLSYIRNRYGTPCSALHHSNNRGWY